MIILTRRLGKVRAVAKGSRRIKSKFGASLEPLTVNEFMLYRKPKRELSIITGANTVRSNLILREDMRIYAYCALMLESVDILTTQDNPHPGVYDLLAGSLEEISAGGQVPAVTWLFIFKLLKVAGYRLDFFECPACGRKDFKKPRFFPGEGSLYCRRYSHRKGVSWPLSAEVPAAIKKLSIEYVISKKAQGEIGNIIKKFIKYEFGKKLKSINFLERILNEDKRVDMNLKVMKEKNVFSGTDNPAK